MGKANQKRLRGKLAIMGILSLVLILVYQFINVNPKIFAFTMMLRTPKTLAIFIAAFCIGTASIVFQSIIQNRIVTPCLLGMNSLYVFVHTSLVFVLGSAHFLVINKNAAFLIDIAIMGLVATVLYRFLFRKTNYNILYVLLAGTVMTTLFGSISNFMTRVMDPNEYDTLLTTLVAGFDHVNADLLVMAVALIILTALIFWNDLKLLDVLTLGKNQAINLGIDYDRTVTRLLVAVTFFITIATALVGPISFLGLIVANISREVFKTYQHTYLMMGAFLAGLLTLYTGQLLIEHIFGFSVMISVFINVIGGGYFLYLILRSDKTL